MRWGVFVDDKAGVYFVKDLRVFARAEGASLGKRGQREGGDRRRDDDRAGWGADRERDRDDRSLLFGSLWPDRGGGAGAREDEAGEEEEEEEARRGPAPTAAAAAAAAANPCLS